MRLGSTPGKEAPTHATPYQQVFSAETGDAPRPATIYGLVGAASRAACGVLVARIQRALNG